MSFRYENYGTADLLLVEGTTSVVSSDVSIFESAFEQTTAAKTFNIPTATELWCKFDIYWAGSTSKFRFYCGDLNGNSLTGCRRNTYGYNEIVLSGTRKNRYTNAITANTRHTVLLHIKSDSTAGIIEFWIDGVKIGDFTGAVNSGNSFENFTLYGDAGVLFSNVIISDVEISTDENARDPNAGIDAELLIDTARTITTTEILQADTQREVTCTENLFVDAVRKTQKEIEKFFDTSRKITVFQVKNFDTERIIELQSQFFVDTERKLTLKLTALNDTERNVKKDIDILADTERNINSVVQLYFDTERNLSTRQEEINFFDVIRNVKKEIEISLDSERVISHTAEIVTDTQRNIKNKIESLLDTSRKLTIIQQQNFDAERVINKKIELFIDTARIIKGSLNIEILLDTVRKISKENVLLLDTKRVPAYGVTLLNDIERNVYRIENVICDTARKILLQVISTDETATGAKVNTAGGVQSINISLTAQSLTDSATIVTANNFVDLGYSLVGSYYNYNFAFSVTELDLDGVIETCKCQSDIDELLYTSLRYKLTKPYTEKQYAGMHEHIATIAEKIGKNLIYLADDYLHNMSLEQQNITYQSLISNLFGWTSRIAPQMINCFLRGNDLYVVQRGHEQNLIDLTNAKRTRPKIHREIERITWSSEADQQTTVTKNVGGLYMVNYMRDNFITSADGNTTFEYSNGRLSHKTTHLPDGKISETNYDYMPKLGGGVYLATETETIYDPSTGETSTTITNHSALGQGQRSSRVYKDGEYQGSMVGNTGGTEGNLFLPDEITWLIAPEDSSYNATIAGNPLIDTSFPLVEDSDLVKVTAILSNLNRKVKESITFEVYDLEHIIDFTDKIILDGTEYFLQSNTIEKTPRIVNKQTLNLVRWLS